MTHLEQVARAIWDDTHPNIEWKAVDKAIYEKRARAALKALQGPISDSMFMRGQPLMTGISAKCDVIWNAMMHAILYEEFK